MAIYIAVENDHRKLILLSATTFAVQAAFDSRPYLRPNLAREAESLGLPHRVYILGCMRLIDIYD